MEWMSRKVLNLILLMVAVLSAYVDEPAEARRRPNPAINDARYRWTIQHDRWSAAHERQFETWVQRLGEAVAARRCRNVDRCLSNPRINPFASSDPRTEWRADCSFWPYLLRSYFAWKNHLPFSYVSQMQQITERNGRPWRRWRPAQYSPWGNTVAERTDVIAPEQGYLNGVRVVKRVNRISSAMFRFHPRTDVSSDGEIWPDTYPTKISRQTIKPGTVIYDPAGHVAVVYKVETDGRILFFDAHPDNSVTDGTYGPRFGRSHPLHGAGFHNWRPIRLMDAIENARGELVGGHIEATRNADIENWGVEQYYGTEAEGLRPDQVAHTRLGQGWRRRGFEVRGEAAHDYYDFVRRKMAEGHLRYRPVAELTNMMDVLCSDLQARAESVEAAIAADVDRVIHPPELPNNIYGTSGEWEEYSTPSRDARLKVAIRGVKERTQEFVERHRRGDRSIQFSGNTRQLIRRLSRVYREKSRACTISYRNSRGRNQTVSLHQSIERAYDLSFDPYHCPELRWGAPEGSPERASCRDARPKRRWYDAQAPLRNNLERRYDLDTDFNLSQMLNPANIARQVELGLFVLEQEALSIESLLLSSGYSGILFYYEALACPSTGLSSAEAGSTCFSKRVGRSSRIDID